MPLNPIHAFVTLATNNFEKLVSFYQQLLKQDPPVYLPQVYAEFHLQGLRLGIFQPKHSHNDEFAEARGSKMSLCLEVEEIESAIAHLTQLGYPPPGQVITASHGQEIYAYDPDGNRLILHQSKSQSINDRIEEQSL
jgi:predicted enzyme related to lactoylglutathione lyase